MEINTVILSPTEQKDIHNLHKKAEAEFEILSGKSLLLIGANGFLGYYLMKSILAWNDNHPKKKIILYALSTFHTGIPTWLQQLKNRKDIKLLKKDITNHSISATQQYDYIIHAASIASPIFYRLHPVETINANVKGLYKILDYLLKRKMTKNPVKGLLFFSTSEIYGDPTAENIPTSETYRGNVSCTGPRACYDESKRFCETLCVNYANVYKLPIVCARPFNNYGPGLKITDGRVIPDFANAILHNKDITMFSSGSPTRTFCYVTDAIAGYMKILTKGKPGEAYNIGVEKPEISIYDLATKMIEIAAQKFGYPGKLKMKKSTDIHYLTDNPQRRCPIITKAKKELGYNPEVTLEDGLTNSLMWYKEQMT